MGSDVLNVQITFQRVFLMLSKIWKGVIQMALDVLLTNVLLPVILGGISGIAFVVKDNKALTKPGKEIHNGKTFYTLGFVGDFLVGAIAGLAAVNLIVPDGSIGQIISIAILGGFNGGAFLTKNALANDDKSLDEIVKEMTKDDKNDQNDKKK